MATYVLVHGAGVGGWYWKRVVPLLRNAGHEVYTPTLTGLGERVHLLNAEIGIETHIQDIVGVIEYEDLTNVILVSHSRGATAAMGAADRVVDRVAHLVHIDGVLPTNGFSEIDVASDDRRTWLLERVVETERGKLLQLPDVRTLGLSDEADIQWFNSKVTPDPFKPWTDPLILRNEAAFAKLPRTYILCIGDQPPGQWRPPWTEGLNFYELRAGHLAMISAPQETVKLLLEVTAPG
jgi:pimeloyl-ACP methyl ester carboxylesterase